MIYLNNAATSWPKPEEVYRAMDNSIRHIAGAPGRGGTIAGHGAGQVLYEAREAAADLFGISNSARLVFTHNATDALNMALFGFLKPGDKVITTAMEHNAVARPLRKLQQSGVDLHIVSCDRAGRIDIADMSAAISKGAQAVVMTHASNVTGTVMPIGEIGAIAAKHGVALVIDAAQTAGVEQIDVKEQNIAMLAFTGHKGLFGPPGTGGLYVRDDITINPLRYGGTGSLSEMDVQPEFLPDRLESGTPNVPGIAGLAAGVHFVHSVGRNVIRQHELKLTRQLIMGLSAIPGVTVFGPGLQEDRTAVVSFNMAHKDNSIAAHMLEQQYGIICRAGLHCAPWAHKTIGTLATGAIRFSPGYFNSEKEIEQAIAAVRLLQRGCEE